MPDPTIELVEYVETEADRVFNHRLRRFMDKGLDEDVATSMALNTQIDVATVGRAIDAGCPFALVLYIWL